METQQSDMQAFLVLASELVSRGRKDLNGNAFVC